MLPCKNKFFKKLLLFSSVFLAFSFFYYKITCANATAMKKSNERQQAIEVIIQQREIISSLKKIEDRVVTRNVTTE